MTDIPHCCLFFCPETVFIKEKYDYTLLDIADAEVDTQIEINTEE
jgi:hypothetical protein